MFRKGFRICYRNQANKIHIVNASFQAKEKWDLFAAVCIERKPSVTPVLNGIETDFAKYLSLVEFERSLKCDHEIRHEQDMKQAAALKNAEFNDVDLDIAAIQTAQDFEDASTEELVQFTFANRNTEADAKCDLTSLEQKLNKHLVLLTEQTLGKNKYFLPPQGIRQDGESLRQTANRVIQESCGRKLKVAFYGNAPAGFYKYRYPKTQHTTDNTVGAKVFIHLARYISGQVSNEMKYKWLDRNGLADSIPTEYYENISKFLIDENSVILKQYAVQ